jgi:hypothetical protein
MRVSQIVPIAGQRAKLCFVHAGPLRQSSAYCRNDFCNGPLPHGLVFLTIGLRGSVGVSLQLAGGAVCGSNHIIGTFDRSYDCMRQINRGYNLPSADPSQSMRTQARQPWLSQSAPAPDTRAHQRLLTLASARTTAAVRKTNPRSNFWGPMASLWVG